MIFLKEPKPRLGSVPHISLYLPYLTLDRYHLRDTCTSDTTPCLPEPSACLAPTMLNTRVLPFPTKVGFSFRLPWPHFPEQLQAPHCWVSGRGQTFHASQEHSLQQVVGEPPVVSQASALLISSQNQLIRRRPSPAAPVTTFAPFIDRAVSPRSARSSWTGVTDLVLCRSRHFCHHAPSFSASLISRHICLHSETHTRSPVFT